MEGSDKENKRFLEEMRFAKGLKEKLEINRVLMSLYTLFGIGMVIWAFVNDRTNNILELTYFVTTFAFCLYNVYLILTVPTEHPFPKKPTLQNLIDFQLDFADEGPHVLKHYFFIGVTPVYLGLLGIISMEYDINHILRMNKTLWIKFSLVQILYAALLVRALYMNSVFKNLARRLAPELEDRTSSGFYL